MINLLDRIAEQISHNHSSRHLSSIRDEEQFAVCGCDWCYICDSQPHECTCEDSRYAQGWKDALEWARQVDR